MTISLPVFVRHPALGMPLVRSSTVAKQTMWSILPTHRKECVNILSGTSEFYAVVFLTFKEATGTVV